jgi:Lar family restriction alleviation protein
MSKLKPCPFCGGEVETTVIDIEWHIHCLDCEIYISFPQGYTRESTIAAWNKREIRLQGASVNCGECHVGIAVDESEQVILCDNPDMKEWYGKNVKHDRNRTCSHGVSWSSHNSSQQKKKPNFANGFDNFCPDCGIFFTVRLEPDVIGSAVFCPSCGNDNLITKIDSLVDHCLDNDTDTINFYKAFSPDEPIPRSRTGATPRQVSIIIDLVAMRKQWKLPVNAENIAGPSDSHIEIVRKVFEELHITETGGAE